MISLRLEVKIYPESGNRLKLTGIRFLILLCGNITLVSVGCAGAGGVHVHVCSHVCLCVCTYTSICIKRGKHRPMRNEHCGIIILHVTYCSSMFLCP